MKGKKKKKKRIEGINEEKVTMYFHYSKLE